VSVAAAREHEAMKSVRARAPVRIDLAGGTLDIWPLYLALGGVVTVNVALDLPVEAVVEPRDGPALTLRSKDLDREVEYADLAALEAARAAASCPLPLLSEAVHAVRPTGGFTLSTSAEPPAGSGLGTSSALLAATVGALLEACGRSRPARDLQPLAQDIETSLLQAPTGHQDYLPPLLGGCLAIHAGVGGLDVRPLPVDLARLAGRLRLAYTGEPHESGITNWGVVKGWLDRDPATREALAALREIAFRTERALLGGDLEAALSTLLEDGRERRRMAPGVTTPGIESLDQAVREAGALGTKICGAGGGGCVLVVLPEEAAGAAVDRILAAGPWQALPVRLVAKGLVLQS
jgi:D-glycero-alpha-D-manno-heptose-7-phosphate kinase